MSIVQWISKQLSNQFALFTFLEEAPVPAPQDMVHKTPVTVKIKGKTYKGVFVDCSAQGQYMVRLDTEWCLMHFDEVSLIKPREQYVSDPCTRVLP